jgi:cytoskeletal protein CcmA (bactofilin family)
MADLGEINALLGRGTEFTGKLTFEGKVRIDGKFSGEIFTDDVLIIGDGADVRAEIDVSTLIIKGGVVTGNVRARDMVEIHAPGKLYGNIVSPALFIDKGVVFEGNCKMTDAAAAGDKRPLAIVKKD